MIFQVVAVQSSVTLAWTVICLSLWFGGHKTVAIYRDTRDHWRNNILHDDAAVARSAAAVCVESGDRNLIRPERQRGSERYCLNVRRISCRKLVGLNIYSVDCPDHSQGLSFRI